MELWTAAQRRYHGTAPAITDTAIVYYNRLYRYHRVCSFNRNHIPIHLMTGFGKTVGSTGSWQPFSPTDDRLVMAQTFFSPTDDCLVMARAVWFWYRLFACFH